MALHVLQFLVQSTTLGPPHASRPGRSSSGERSVPHPQPPPPGAAVDVSISRLCFAAWDSLGWTMLMSGHHEDRMSDTSSAAQGGGGSFKNRNL